MVRIYFTVLLSLVCFFVQSQEKCGTVEYEKFRHQRNPSRETIDQFERWMKNKLLQKAQAIKSDRVESQNYIVPVVVHIIHNGESVGSGTNISDAQILSQIPVINNDFLRLNADTTKTPTEFKSVAGKMNITFVMAKQDPNGLATTGIVRVKGTQTSWSISDNNTFKALSYWPSEDYLNIWVVNLSGGLIGYTQLPASSTLAGLSDASDDPLTDGVVIDYQTYGTSQATGGSSFNLLSEYALGRTATHEIGHFFGLRHVWGDVNSCDPSVSTDYCDDTPIQNTNYNGQCPSVAQTECGVHSMYDNYMNYTDDACMNIFSQGQVSRMNVIINNSPRRVSLLTSPGSQPPSPVANDLGIKAITNPGTTVCSGNVIPSLTVRNYGANVITSTQIQFSLNGNPVETKSFSLANLDTAKEASVSFSSVAVSSGISYSFLFKILQTNGGNDGNPANDTLSVSTLVPVAASLPLTQAFNTLPTGWQILNPDGLITWSTISLTGSNNAVYMDFYNYDNQGTSDWLITPVLDLTAATVASLSFDYAYAPYQSANDQLRVLVTTTCDFTQSPIELFNKSGSTLATASSPNGLFTPTASQWSTFTASLNQFIGQKIQIAFVGTNDYGNNLYLDNVSVLNTPVVAVALNNLVSPSPVSCNTTTSPIISLKNLGNVNISSFSAEVYVNNQLSTELISGVQLSVGASQNFSLSPVIFSNGNNTLSIAVKLPNGVSNYDPSNDSLSTTLLINNSSDIIPLRQNFDGTFAPAWSIVSPSSGQLWSPTTTNYSTSMIFNSFTNSALGEKAWLVSSVLDFSKASEASVFFQTSYASNNTGSETLQVLASTDCGETFNQIVFTSSGTSLSNTTSNVSWLPTSSNQWTKNFINLDTLAGKENIRVAFVATNGNGNNLYLDNIEFFTSDNQTPVAVSSLYSVYGGLGTPVNVTFDLPDRQLVRMQVYDLMGRIISDNMLPETLNQTYTIDFPNDAKGMYIVRIQTATSIGSTKVLLGF